MPSDRDPRRYRVIEVRRVDFRTWHLSIDGQMWSEVEWSATRQAWCIQDAAGHCLTHVEHIVGQDVDGEAAIRLAKRMIVDGRMPTPEQARASLQAGQPIGDKIGADFATPKAPRANTRELLEALKLPSTKRAGPK